MGVYIKGITIEQIKKCTMYTMDGGCVEFYDGRLIEVVEPHGRLIDVTNIYTKDGFLEFDENEAPTIIEAEG